MPITGEPSHPSRVCRLMLPVIAIAVLLTACLADAAGGASKPALAGNTKIREVKVLRPSEGRERGSLVVWVNATHGPLSRAAEARTFAGSTHAGEVRVRIKGLGRRRASQDLSLSSEPGLLTHGYTVRFEDRRSRRQLRGLAAAPKLRVRVAATQRVDLEGDGDTNGARSDEARRRVRPSSVQSTIDPPNGGYATGENASTFWVNAGRVIIFSPSNNVGCVTDIVANAPIDPSNGKFAYDNVKGVTASGTFQPDGTTAEVVASWSGVLGAGGPKCHGTFGPLPFDPRFP